MTDELGDRMKLYEGMEAGRRLMPLLPIIARIDGRSFHTFTRGMRRPFDPKFSQAMIDTTVALVKETGACMGYTQSDEITLAWHSPTMQSQVWFDGRVAKMTSQLGAQATLAERGLFHVSPSCKPLVATCRLLSSNKARDPPRTKTSCSPSWAQPSPFHTSEPALRGLFRSRRPPDFIAEPERSA